MRRGRPVTKVVDPWETPLCYPALCREMRGRDRMLGSVPQTPERSGGDQHLSRTSVSGTATPNGNGKSYDHAVVQQQLNFLDTELERANPGSLAVLRENGLDPLDAGYLLANVIPRLVTTEIKY